MCVKANDQMIKSNYRPIAVLLAAATKVYERLMTEQMAAYSETFKSPYICGFARTTILNMLLQDLLKNVNQSWTKKDSQEQS